MAMFLILIIFSMIFFIARLGFKVFNLFNKETLYKNNILKVASDISFLVYLLVLIALLLALCLAGDYGNAERDLTLIVVGIVAALYIANTAIKYSKNRDYFIVESNLYDFKGLLKVDEFKDILLPCDIGFYKVRKDNFDTLLGLLQEENKKLKQPKAIALGILKDILPILLCIAVLVLGIVRRV